MATQFRRRASLRSGTVPNNDEHAKWLALMQHHGLPTRLLDWTDSILVAAYFVASESQHHGADGVIWVLSPRALNRTFIEKDVILTPDDPFGEVATALPLVDVRSFPPPLAGMANQLTEAVVALEPTEHDLRMLIQQSEFTVHGSSIDLREHSQASRFLGRIVVPAPLKVSLAQALAHVGIRLSTLFPDLDHLSRELQDHATFDLSDLAKWS